MLITLDYTRFEVPKPFALTECGFRDADHVRMVAHQYGTIIAHMNTKDVVQHMKKHFPHK